MNILRHISRLFYFHRRGVFRHAGARIAAWAMAAVIAPAQTALATTVRIETTLGTIDVALYDDLTPKTVMNFLRYAGRGDYTLNGFVHFSSPGVAMRGGGFTFSGDPENECLAYDLHPGQTCYMHIPEDPPIPDELSTPLLNARGTIAAFRPCAIVNQETKVCEQWSDTVGSEWTINLAENSASLNNVFGEVVAGLDFADAIGGLPVYNAVVPGIFGEGLRFSQIPLIGYDPGAGMQPNQLVRVLRIPNISGVRTPSGDSAIFTADVDMTFETIEAIHADVDSYKDKIGEFTPPTNSQVFFNNGMYAFLLSGVIGQAEITMHDSATLRPIRYYAYGPTSDDNSPHWYDFSFDGATGAVIESDRIVLHFVDGGRGDDDLTVNGSITHSGAQAVLEQLPSTTTNSGGCSIAAAGSRAVRGGDWALIFLFLGFIAVLRRRPRPGRTDPDVHARVTNIPSP